MKATFYQNQEFSLSTYQKLFLSILNMNSAELKDYIEEEYLENPFLEKSDSAHTSSEISPVEYSALFSEYQMLTDMHEFIWDQIDRSNKDKEEIDAINTLIEHLDPNGFLSENISQISRECNVSEKVLFKCLLRLRMLEPIGIFQPDIQHCLLSQYLS